MIQWSHMWHTSGEKQDPKRYMHHNVHSKTKLFIIAKTWRHNGTNHRKEWNNAICSNIEDLEIIIPSEVSQNERKTNIIQHHLHVEPKIWYKSTYLWNKNRLTDIENRLAVAKGKGVGEGRIGSLELAGTNNKVLLYSTENYIQYPVTNHNGKECEREYTHVHITESCCTEKINTF